jgi:hypothetical protein
MHLWVFLSLTLPGQEQEEKRVYYTREHGAASTIQLDDLGDGTHSKGDPRHCTLNFYTKVQVWERMVKNLTTSSIYGKGHPKK